MSLESVNNARAKWLRLAQGYDTLELYIYKSLEMLRDASWQMAVWNQHPTHVLKQRPYTFWLVVKTLL